MDSLAADPDLCEASLLINHNWMAIKAYDPAPRGPKYTEPAALAIPPQRHFLLEGGFKGETYNVNLINRLDVICRFCLDENESLFDIFGSNDCVVVMIQSLVDVKIKADDMLPKQICTHCYKLLNQCLAFKQQVSSTDTALRRCIDQLKLVQIGNQKKVDDPSSSATTEQHAFDAISTRNEWSYGHKFEDLIEEENYTPDYETVCEKDSKLHSDYDETVVRGHDSNIDCSPEVKREPTTTPSDVNQPPLNVQRQRRTSVKCEQCDKKFFCNSILQRHIKLHTIEKLEYQCSVCSQSFCRQAGLKAHMCSHKRPNEDAEEQANAFKCAKCNTSFSLERDLYIHGSIHPVDDRFRCLHCGKDFPMLAKLRRHVKTHYENNPINRDRNHVCKECGNSYFDAQALSVHYRTHTGDKPLLATKCNKRFTDSRSIKWHTRMHANVKNFSCTVCQKAFIHRDTLKNHMRLHSSAKPFVCNVCNESFGLKLNLIHHLRVHSGEKPYKCSHCSKPLSSSKALAIHVRTHTGEKPYKCSHCSKSFGLSSTLAVHVRTHTGEKPYKCSHCSKPFGSSSALAMHFRTHTGERPYKCSHCSKSFGQSSTLAIHVRMHTGERPFICKICDKSFRIKWNLIMHMRAHSGERPYKCSHCSKSFGSSSTLSVHVRTHTGEKPYKCVHCSKSFGSSSTLTVHVRTHTGEKPYICPHCSNSFRASSALAKHIRTHADGKLYKCPHCSITFRTSSALTKHVRTHTGGNPYSCNKNENSI